MISMILPFIFKLLGFGIDIFVKNAATKAKWQKKILEASARYEKTADAAADIRTMEQRCDEELKAEWEKKWGGATNPTKFSIWVPSVGKVNAPFSLVMNMSQDGADLFLNDSKVMNLLQQKVIPLTCTVVGLSTIKIVKKGETLATCKIMIDEA